jgi:hypothetical protein
MDGTRLGWIAIARVCVLLVTVGVVLVGCDDSDEHDRAGEGEACQYNTDCQVSLGCFDGVCKKRVPDCPEEMDCTGLACGLDPVCGQSCGDCETGLSCVEGECKTVPPDCPDQKDCTSTQCGPDPVCGLPCGDCETGEICHQGHCVLVGPDCPGDQDCFATECGLDPVCNISCGECAADQVCESGLCQSAGPTCPEDMACLQAECGPDPICGLSCGTCEDGEKCGEGKCMVLSANCPDDQDCSLVECGVDPVCGLLCPPCPEGQTCKSNTCIGPAWVDPTSGLSWQVVPPDETFLLAEAEAYCDGLVLDGGGWRLPTISELRTLIRGCAATETGGTCNLTDECPNEECWNQSCQYHDNGCETYGGPAWYGAYWPEDIAGSIAGYLSSTQFEDKSWEHWGVGFIKASIGHYNITFHPLAVRCVRQ